MWTIEAMWICGLLAFLGGFITAGIMVTAAQDSLEKTAEKRGVWIIKDRAYQLTPIPK